VDVDIPYVLEFNAHKKNVDIMKKILFNTDSIMLPLGYGLEYGLVSTCLDAKLDIMRIIYT